MGKVTRLTLKSDAERAVKGIEGLENVSNQIEVAAPFAVRRPFCGLRSVERFTAPNSLQRYALPVIKPIRIIVKNWHATLEGVVNSKADKNVVSAR